MMDARGITILPLARVRDIERNVRRAGIKGRKSS
jgi:hypothetical protein